MKKLFQYAAALLFAILVGGVSLAPGTASATGLGEAGEMQVHYIDVGQGDCTLITCGGQSMLIDAGDAAKGTAIQNYLNKQKIDRLDYLVLTHPDEDHIGGAPVIITKFDIGQVFVSGYKKENKVCEKLIQALDYRNLKYTTPEAGSEYPLGTAVIKILAPNGEYDNPNDSSIALSIKNGGNTFLFTGDAGEAAQKDILENHIDISADVYKAGHHGSKDAASEEFLRAVAPACAVISCGEDNPYGHPHAETLNMFRINGVAVYRTDEDGTIIAVSDGETIVFNVPASETWKAGEPARAEEQAEAGKTTETVQNTGITYILNISSKKFHRLTCNSLPTANRLDSCESREEIIAQGYMPCKRCNP